MTKLNFCVLPLLFAKFLFCFCIIIPPFLTINWPVQISIRSAIKTYTNTYIKKQRLLNSIEIINIERFFLYKKKLELFKNCDERRISIVGGRNRFIITTTTIIIYSLCLCDFFFSFYFQLINIILMHNRKKDTK